MRGVSGFQLFSMQDTKLAVVCIPLDAGHVPPRKGVFVVLHLDLGIIGHVHCLWGGTKQQVRWFETHFS